MVSKFMTVSETAAYLGLPESSLRYWLTQGLAPKSKKIGRRRQFEPADVDEWVEAGGPDGARERLRAESAAS